MKLLSDRRFVFHFWAVMDIAYLTGLVCGGLWCLFFGAGVCDEIEDRWLFFMGIIVSGNVEIIMLQIFIPVLLVCSMIMSAKLLIRQHRNALKVVLWQSPFRVIYFMPSLVFIPESSGLELGGKIFVWLLIIGIELFKVCSLAEVEQDRAEGAAGERSKVKA